MGDSLFVIHSTFLLEVSHNTFHGAPLLQDSSGRDTTMLFGFARDLLRLRKQFGMRKALIVLGNDLAYLPDSCISEIADFLKRLHVPVLYSKSVRVGNVCTALAECCTWIVTGNKAMLQLISDRCNVIVPKKGSDLDVGTVASMRDQLGVSPSQVPYLFALTEKSGHGSLLTQRQAVRFLELHGTLETGLQKAAAGHRGQVGRKLLTRPCVPALARLAGTRWALCRAFCVESGRASFSLFSSIVERVRSGAERSRERRFWARRSVPVTASTDANPSRLEGKSFSPSFGAH